MHTNLFDLTAILSGISLFEGLAPAALVELARSAHIANLPKGRTAYSAGDPSRALYYLLSGQLKVAVSSPEGGEKVFDIVSPRQTFGVAELFGQASHVSFAEAVNPAVVLIVGREGVFRAIEQDARLSLRMLNVVANRQASIERDIAADCFQSGMGKVVEYLLREAGAGPDTSHCVQFELAIPKHLLAARLGFTPETLSRIFRELSDAGFIRVCGKQVTLLEALLRDRCVSAMPAKAVPPRRQNARQWFDQALPGRGALVSQAWV